MGNRLESGVGDHRLRNLTPSNEQNPFQTMSIGHGFLLLCPFDFSQTEESSTSVEFSFIIMHNYTNPYCNKHLKEGIRMMLNCESNSLEDYLIESEEVDFHHLSIKEKASEIFSASSNEEEFVQKAYEFVRDEISHSWDIQSSRITCKASEALYFKEGICYAKSNLLCALLRSRGIPAGFCYQRLTVGDTPDTGYCIHALNAVFLKSQDKWIRLDARGNKDGVNAEFSLHDEKLAFAVREHYNEIDYQNIYKSPNSKTIHALRQHTNCINMYLHGLPSEL
jgi:hypothetical protein